VRDDQDPPVAGDASGYPDPGHTEEYPTMVEPAGAPAGQREPSPRTPEADEDDEWLSTGPARGIRLALPLAALLAVVLVAAGFWGGAALEKGRGGGSGGGGAAGAAFAARFRATRGAGGGGGGGGGFTLGGSTGGTTGTISVVAGNTLYVLTATGALVKVTLTPSTTITRNASAKPLDLRPGDTVTVQGATGPGGNVAASSISATAPGVSSTAGGLGGGAAAGGSAALGGTTTTSAGG
jgi:hypothetical protein